MRKILFILGAGASRSISPKVPLVEDFFEKCLPFLEDPDKHPEIWLAFAILEEGRCFQEPNKELENAAAYIMAAHWQLIDFGRMGPGQPNLKDTPAYNRLEEAHRDLVKHYLKLCGEAPSRTRANLESVFSRAEREERYRFRPILALNFLLGQLQKEFSTAAPHAVLARGIKRWLEREGAKTEVSLLSFNYDVWLERELQRERVWHPRMGYGVAFEKFMDLPMARRIEDQQRRLRESGAGAVEPFSIKQFVRSFDSQVCVLKPHGSLSWYRHEKSGDSLVMLEEGEDSLVTVNEGRWYLRDLWGEGQRERTYEPLFVPPAPQKRRKGPLFFEIDKRIDAELTEADTVVVIGWSMPKTDLDWESRIRHVIDHRPRQLQQLIVCNLADSKPEDIESVTRIESGFRPAMPVKIFGSGFENSAEEMWNFLREAKPSVEEVKSQVFS